MQALAYKEQAAHGSPQADHLAQGWEAIQRAAGALCSLLGRSPHSAALNPVAAPRPGVSLEQAVGDLCAMLEQGLFVILKARENGADGQIAARTLLERYDKERRRLLVAEATAPR